MRANTVRPYGELFGCYHLVISLFEQVGAVFFRNK